MNSYDLSETHIYIRCRKLEIPTKLLRKIMTTYPKRVSDLKLRRNLVAGGSGSCCY